MIYRESVEKTIVKETIKDINRTELSVLGGR